MITIPANDAIGIGHVFKEATGFVIFPCKGRIKTFQIHPDYGAFVIIVKDGVLDNAGSQHKIVSGGSSKRIILFLETAFHFPQRNILEHSPINVIRDFSDT